jgi:hypothetical protein
MRSGCLFVLWLGLGSLEMARAGEPARFDLDLNRPSPKAGDVAVRTIRVFSSSSNTNQAKGQVSITNSFHTFDVQARERILTWDVSNDVSKVDMTLAHFVDNADGRTNELAKSGTRLTGTSIAGETFFHTVDGDLSVQGYEQLRQFYGIRPRDFNEFAHSPMPRQIPVGATWEIPKPTNITAMAGFFGASYTNAIRATGQFVGTTNLFGFDCFHLRLQAVATELPEYLRNVMTHGLPLNIKSKVNLTVDLIVPFDTSKSPLMTGYSLDFWMVGDLTVDGKTALSTQGRTTLEIISECQPIPQP